MIFYILINQLFSPVPFELVVYETVNYLLSVTSYSSELETQQMKDQQN
jgi:hypothetical protein